MVSLAHVTGENVWWKNKFKQIGFQFFTKGVYSFRRFNRNRELFPSCWRNHRESTFAHVQLSVRNKRLFETDDIRVIDISEKSSRLTKCVCY